MKIDQYVLQARVAPLAMALLPVGILAGLLGSPKGLGLSIGIVLGGPVVLALVGADIVRSLGRDLEVRLWNRWGGSPSTVAFLIEDATGTDRRHRLQSVTGVMVRPDRLSVERATSALRDLANDAQRFPRIPIANIAYGRARHLLALRPSAFRLAIAVDIFLVYLLTPLPLPEQLASIPTSKILLAAGLTAIVTVFWVTFPSEQRLRCAGDDYADRLLAALDVLSDQNGTG